MTRRGPMFRELCFAAIVAGASRATAQLPPPTAYAEFRGDVIAGRGTAAQGGLGAVVPLGAYVRLSLDGAVGSTWRDGTTLASGRVDAIGRFLLDPFREMPFGLSLGGGLSLPVTQGDRRTRPYLTAVVDIEGRKHGPLTPALQLGLGGGMRIGLVFRTSAGRWR
jgi:hypothetical protein